MTRRTVGHRAGAAAGLAAAVILLTAAPAFAHVVIEPDTAPAGNEQTISVRVPNEIDGAHTIKVEVDFPVTASDGGPIPSVSVEPVVGWTFTEQTQHLTTPIQTDDGQVTDVVSQIVWSAAPGGGIGTGEYQRFALLVTLPDKPGKMIFKAIQTYDNGTVVRWIEPPNPDGSAPDHPYPTLTLQAASATAGASSTTAAPTVATTAAKTSSSSSDTAGIVGIVVGAVALVIAAAALIRGRRPTGP